MDKYANCTVCCVASGRVARLHVSYCVKVCFSADVQDFNRDSVDVGDEAVHSGAGAEFALFDEVDGILDWAAVRGDEKWVFRLFDDVDF